LTDPIYGKKRKNRGSEQAHFNHHSSKISLKMGSVQCPAAVDLSHHLNAHSKARHPSPLKEIIRFMGYEGMISLAGGNSYRDRTAAEQLLKVLY